MRAIASPSEIHRSDLAGLRLGSSVSLNQPQQLRSYTFRQSQIGEILTSATWPERPFPTVLRSPGLSRPMSGMGPEPEATDLELELLLSAPKADPPAMASS